MPITSTNQVRSAMSSINTFQPRKLSIVLIGYFVDGERTGREECKSIITIAGTADESTHAI